MSDYNASTLIKIMQDGLAETQENAGRLILDPVAQQVQVDVDGKMITNLVKRKKDVHTEIKNALTRPDVVAKAEAAIKTDVVPRISRILIDDICIRILNGMRGDKTVPSKTVKRMQAFYDNDQYDEFFAMAILYGLSRNNLSGDPEASDSDVFLVEEANYSCPLTGEKLYRKVKGETLRRYRIVQIYPDDLTAEQAVEFDKIQLAPPNLDSLDNQIALCPDCAEAYLHNPTPQEYARLLQKKKEIVRIHAGKMAAFGFDLEREIEDIIKAVIGINKRTQLKSFTEPVKVKEKIRPEFYVLQQEMEDRVVKYYPFIEDKFSLLDGVNGASFNVIRSEVNAVYEKLEAAGMNQEEICEELSNWILDSFGFGSTHKTAGYIVVSFFIQLCDVFHPLKASNVEEAEEGGITDEITE